MRIFLASQFGRKEELRGYRDTLRELGVKVVSRWLDQGQDDPLQYPNYARDNKEDILDCHFFVLFTSEYHDGPYTENQMREYSRGGRHYEAGFAYANNKTMVVIGPRENIYYYDGVSVYKTFQEFLSIIRLLQAALISLCMTEKIQKGNPVPY